MRALVLSGGGAKGAYQVGVLQYLMGDLGVKYDAYCGTSVGAINAAFLAQFPVGEEKVALAELASLWSNLDSAKVYKKWYSGLLWLLPALWKPSVYSTSPLQQLITHGLDPARLKTSGKLLRVGAVSLDTMKRYVWTEVSPAIVKGVMASAAMPAFFEPVFVRGNFWTDGGIREGTPLQDAISLGGLKIDVVVLDQEGPESAFSAKPTTLDVAGRAIDTMLHEITEWDLKCAELHNQLARAGLSNKRLLDIRVLRPSSPLGDALDFSPKMTRKRVAQGFEDARAMKW